MLRPEPYEAHPKRTVLGMNPEIALRNGLGVAIAVMALIGFSNVDLTGGFSEDGKPKAKPVQRELHPSEMSYRQLAWKAIKDINADTKRWIRNLIKEKEESPWEVIKEEEEPKWEVVE